MKEKKLNKMSQIKMDTTVIYIRTWPLVGFLAFSTACSKVNVTTSVIHKFNFHRDEPRVCWRGMQIEKMLISSKQTSSTPARLPSSAVK